MRVRGALEAFVIKVSEKSCHAHYSATDKREEVKINRTSNSHCLAKIFLQDTLNLIVLSSPIH